LHAWGLARDAAVGKWKFRYRVAFALPSSTSLVFRAPSSNTRGRLGKHLRDFAPCSTRPPRRYNEGELWSTDAARVLQDAGSRSGRTDSLLSIVQAHSPTQARMGSIDVIRDAPEKMRAANVTMVDGLNAPRIVQRRVLELKPYSHRTQSRGTARDTGIQRQTRGIHQRNFPVKTFAKHCLVAGRLRPCAHSDFHRSPGLMP